MNFIYFRNAAFFAFALIYLTACKKQTAEWKNCLRADSDFCGYMCFDAKKGNNLSEAIQAIKFEGIRSNYSDLNEQITELKGVKNESGEPVDGKHYFIQFLDPKTGNPVHGVSDAISETGDHYNVYWCQE